MADFRLFQKRVVCKIGAVLAVGYQILNNIPNFEQKGTKFIQTYKNSRLPSFP